jgi:signal transduction histidine kinase
MNHRLRSSLRARIVVAFTALGLVFGFAAVAIALAASHGARHLLPYRDLIAFGGAGALAVLGIVGGRLLARRVLAPIEALGELIDTHKAEDLADALADRTYDREIGALALRLEDAMRRLQASVSREQRFTRYASHELRSPVAVIKGAAELLRTLPECEAERVAGPLARIERSVAEMESLIHVFVWLGRERAELERDDLATEVEPAVRTVAERYAHLAADKPVELELRVDGSPGVHAPVVELVMGNLVANALHYTEAGRVTIDVNEHSVTVADTGPGMTAEHLDRAGESFVRGERSLGYGIGLSMVQSLADRFGWRLRLDSAPGQGTTARVYF